MADSTTGDTSEMHLLPCPFCGCVDFAIESLVKINGKSRKRVMCKRCNACGPESWNDSAYYSMVNARKAWNFRSL